MSILAGYGTIPLKTETRIIKSNIHHDPENSKKPLLYQHESWLKTSARSITYIDNYSIYGKVFD